MIPASYFYKELYTQHWGNPCNQREEPVEPEPRGPGRGHFAGIAGLLTAVLPLELERGRQVVRQA